MSEQLYNTYFDTDCCRTIFDEINITEDNTEYVINRLKQVLAIKDKYKSAYLFNIPYTMRERKKDVYNFIKNNHNLILRYGQDEIYIEFVYGYHGNILSFSTQIYVNDDKKDIRYIKKMIKILEKKLEK